MTERTEKENELTYLPEDDSLTGSDDIYSDENNDSELCCDSELPHDNQSCLPMPLRTLQPMSIGDIFGEVISLYSNHGMVLIKSMAIINLPAIVIAVTTIGLAFISTQAFITGSVLLTLGGLPFQIIAMTAAPAVIAKIVSDSFLGKEVDLWESLDFVWQKIGTVMSAMVGSWLTIMAGNFAIAIGLTLAGILLIIGAMTVGFIAAKLGAVAVAISKIVTIIGMLGTALLLMVGGIGLLGATYAIMFLSPIVAVIEDKSWFDAPKRSFELVFKSSWSALRFLGILIAAYLTVGAISIGIMLPLVIGAQILSGVTGIVAFTQIVQSLVGIISMVALVPAASSVTALLYYDHRIRHENFSLDELIKSKVGKQLTER